MSNYIFSLTEGNIRSTKPQQLSSPYNWVFIDAQNLYQGIKQRGWKLNWSAFREYLYEAHNVTRSVIFIGRIKANNWLYHNLNKSGFHIEFKLTFQLADGSIDGGNIDADLTSYLMDNKTEYSQAIVFADDTDYLRTLQSLNRQGKIGGIISSHLIVNASSLLRRVFPSNMFIPIQALRNKIEFKTKYLSHESN